MAQILIVDDDKAVRDSLDLILDYAGFKVSTAANGMDGLKAIQNEKVDLVLLDIKMPGIDGLEVLGKLQEMESDIPVIIISGHGDIATAVKATKLGAYDFLEKPLEKDRLLVTVQNGLKTSNLKQENKNLREKLQNKYEIIGQSPAMKQIKELMARVAPTEASVFIFGDNGTGKELVAQGIHMMSNRANEKMVEVNCAAIPKDLIESELFGHEKGSFTGAVDRKIGKFESANKGTLFLDEVGDMSLPAQAKLLRVLETGSFERVGGNQKISVNVRVIAATNKNLLKEIEANNFRIDLYHRLNRFPINVPPLRERKDDISLLIDYFMKRYAVPDRIPVISKEVMNKLVNYHWPGNVRELHNLIERMIILFPGKTVSLGDIEFLGLAPIGVKTGSSEGLNIPWMDKNFADFKDWMEMEYLRRRLEASNWNISQTAKDIDMQRSNLYAKLEKFDMKKEGLE